MKNPLSLLALLMLLTSCAGMGSDPVYLTRCPLLIEYSAETRTRAADELASLPPDAALLGMVADYATLRERCRIFEKER